MKRVFIITVVMLVCSVMFVNAEEDKPGWFRRNFGELRWGEIKTVAKTPRAICNAVRRRVRYTEDLGDNWATGKEAWEKKQGDCEDFAVCVFDLCRTNGIEVEIQVFAPKGSWEAHAVVVGSWNGKLWISSNGWYVTINSMDEAKAVIAKEQGWRHKEILVASLEDVKNGVFVP